MEFQRVSLAEKSAELNVIAVEKQELLRKEEKLRHNLEQIEYWARGCELFSVECEEKYVEQNNIGLFFLSLTFQFWD